MGGEFARHIAAAGIRTLGYDVLPEKTSALKTHGGEICASPAAVAVEADIILTSLPSVKALEDALFGEQGIASSKRNGILVIETSTLPLEAKESARTRLAGAKAAGNPYDGRAGERHGIAGGIEGHHGAGERRPRRLRSR